MVEYSNEERTSQFDYQEERKALLDYVFHLKNRDTEKQIAFYNLFIFVCSIIIGTIPIYLAFFDIFKRYISSPIGLLVWCVIWGSLLISVHRIYNKSQRNKFVNIDEKYQEIITSIMRTEKDNDEIYEMIKNVKKSGT